MSASISHLVALPIEILERTLLYLPSQDIIKIQSVNRLFQDLVCTLPALQHQCDLFAIGLIDNPCNSCDLYERRKLCGRYTRKWSKAARSVKSTHKLTPDLCSSDWRFAKYSGNGLLVTTPKRDGSPTFLHIPSVASGKPVKDWSISLHTARILDHAVYPLENVIAVAKQRELTVRVHFFNLRDGSPHSSPTSTITWEFPPGNSRMFAHNMAITSSRIMMTFTYLDEGPGSVWEIAVWCRKTGELVLDLSSTDGSELVKKNAQAIFLDEFRVVVIPNGWAITELAVFDTLIPQDHPGYVQRLALPLEFCDKAATIQVDRDRDFGTPDKDEALLPDPAQAVLIINLTQNLESPALLVMRKQVLVKRVDSVCTDFRVPWDEWGRDAVVIQVQNDDDHEFTTFVHGAQVMVARGPGCYDVRIFDFGRRGRGSLPLRGGADGTERSLLFEDGTNLRFELGLVLDPFDALEPLSDGSLIHLGRGQMGDSLQVWELC